LQTSKLRSARSTKSSIDGTQRPVDKDRSGRETGTHNVQALLAAAMCGVLTSCVAACASLIPRLFGSSRAYCESEQGPFSGSAWLRTARWKGRQPASCCPTLACCKFDGSGLWGSTRLAFWLIHKSPTLIVIPATAGIQTSRCAAQLWYRTRCWQGVRFRIGR